MDAVSSVSVPGKSTFSGDEPVNSSNVGNKLTNDLVESNTLHVNSEHHLLFSGYWDSPLFPRLILLKESQSMDHHHTCAWTERKLEGLIQCYFNTLYFLFHNIETHWTKLIMITYPGSQSESIGRKPSSSSILEARNLFLAPLRVDLLLLFRERSRRNCFRKGKVTIKCITATNL